MAFQESRVLATGETERLSPILPDPLYIAARRVLLDALEAFAPYRRSLILVGAQAVYLRTAEARLMVAPFTIDGDIAIDPTSLPSHPPLEQVLSEAGFDPGMQPGSWTRVTTVRGRAVTVDVDFMVPAAVAPGSGSRSVALEGHSRRATRRVPGLEAALVDHDPIEISAIEPIDARRISIEVAGAAALVIAKIHKIADRQETARGGRTQVDKDAGDIYRLMQVTRVGDMAVGFKKALAADASRSVADSALRRLGEYFGRVGRPGVEMTIRAVGVGGEAPETIRSVVTAYVAELQRNV